MATVDSTAVEYRGIPNFPGYRVGNDGSVWSHRIRICLGHGGKAISGRSNRWRRLRMSHDKDGYLHIALAGDFGNKTWRVHRLVAMLFIGPAPEGYHVCHGDGDKENNTYNNLRYDTVKGNHADKERHGTKPVGEKSGTAKLTVATVREIRESLALGVSQNALSKKYKVDRRTISRVLLRKTWSHVT